MTVKRFTLVELLVVVAIIGILAALLLPALSRARFKAKLVIDASNQRQTFLGMHLFADDNNNNFMVPWGAGDPWNGYVAKRGTVWHNTGLLYQEGYVSDYSVFYCPLAEIPGTREVDYVESGTWSSNSDNGYMGNYVRTSYLVNSYWFKKAGQHKSHNPKYISSLSTHRAMYEQYGSRADIIAAYETVETPERAVFIIDRFNSPAQILHGEYFTTTLLDGSTRILKSKPAYISLITGNDTDLQKYIQNMQLLIP